MATTLANYITYLDNDLTRDPNHRIRTQTTKERAINRWYISTQMAIGMQSRTMETSASSSQSAWDNTYTLPSDFLGARLVEWEGNPLILTTNDEIRRIETTSTSGTPSHYYITWDTLYIRPTPASAGTLTVYYNHIEATLTSGVDSALPTYYDHAVILYAAYSLFMSVDPSKASQYYQARQEALHNVSMGMLLDAPYRMRYERWGQDTSYPDRL